MLEFRLGIDATTEFPVERFIDPLKSYLNTPGSGSVVLFGTANAKTCFDTHDLLSDRVAFILCPDAISMDDDPTAQFCRRPQSSIWKLTEALKHRELDAGISAGNTGFVTAYARVNLKCIRGKTLALAPFIPCRTHRTGRKHTCLIDAGSNPSPCPTTILEYYHLGRAHSTAMHGVAEPVSGFLSMGQEPWKGGEFGRAVCNLLKGLPYHYGNIEYPTRGEVDVVLTHVGNLVLKAAEDFGTFPLDELKICAEEANVFQRAALRIARPVLRKTKHLLDTDAAGNTPVVNVSHLLLKLHGDSSSAALLGGMHTARQLHNDHYITKMHAALCP